MSDSKEKKRFLFFVHADVWFQLSLGFVDFKGPIFEFSTIL